MSQWKLPKWTKIDFQTPCYVNFFVEFWEYDKIIEISPLNSMQKYGEQNFETLPHSRLLLWISYGVKYSSEELLYASIVFVVIYSLLSSKIRCVSTRAFECWTGRSDMTFRFRDNQGPLFVPPPPVNDVGQEISHQKTFLRKKLWHPMFWEAPFNARLTKYFTTFWLK